MLVIKAHCLQHHPASVVCSLRSAGWRASLVPPQLAAQARGAQLPPSCNCEASSSDSMTNMELYRFCAGGASSSGREHVFQPDPDAKPLFPSSYKGGEIALAAAPLPNVCNSFSLDFRLSRQPGWLLTALFTVFLGEDSLYMQAWHAYGLSIVGRHICLHGRSGARLKPLQRHLVAAAQEKSQWLRTAQHSCQQGGTARLPGCPGQAPAAARPFPITRYPELTA